MITQEKLYHSIILLRPDAAFSFWKNDGRQGSWVDDSQTYSIIDDWCVAWANTNQSPCPSLEEINSITQDQVIANIASQRLAYYTDRYSRDVAVLSNYEMAKIGNPALTFEEYVVYLLGILDSMQS